MAPLEYENEIFTQVLDDNALVVLGKVATLVVGAFMNCG